MGSDLGPEELIIGVRQALSSDKSDFRIIVVGDDKVISPLLVRHDVLKDNRVQVYNASEVIEMDEKPIQAMKTKRDSSMMRAIDLVKIGHCRRRSQLRKHRRSHGGRHYQTPHNGRH